MVLLRHRGVVLSEAPPPGVAQYDLDHCHVGDYNLGSCARSMRSLLFLCRVVLRGMKKFLKALCFTPFGCPVCFWVLLWCFACLVFVWFCDT